MMNTALEIVTTDGLTLRGHRLGEPSDPPVLFLHGGGQTRFAWDATMQRVADQGWQAVAVDLRGHGESAWAADGDYRTATMAADIAAWVDLLGQPPVYVGASMGGLAALHHLGSPGASGRGLVLVDVVIEVDPSGAQHIRDFMLARPDGFASLDEAAAAVADYGSGRRRSGRPDGLLANLRIGDDGRYRWHWDPRLLEGASSADVMRSQRDLEQRARAVTVPVLLVRGGRSRVVSDEGVAHLRSAIPHAEVVSVEAAGHMVVGDANDQFATSVDAFLHKVAAGEAGRPRS